jgi:GH24 family phage-related lysozyme (muramidase)
MVKKLEGFSAKAYPDHKQYSIGYGTKASGPNDTITEPEAAEKMKAVLDNAARYVINFAKAHGYQWGQNQIDALSSFVYNGGKGFLDQITKGGKRTNQEIAQYMPQYNKASGKVDRGLVNRRRTELALFQAGLSDAKIGMSDIQAA